jgi:membrane glycosyltransferase
MLMAPIMMLFHSEFVLRALFGRSVGWDAQPRGDRGVTWHEAFLRHRWHVAIGLVWGAAILLLAPSFIWWMLPVVIGMLIAVPFTALTSRSALGQALRRHGLLLTPEETAPPPELLAAEAARARAETPARLLDQSGDGAAAGAAGHDCQRPDLRARTEAAASARLGSTVTNFEALANFDGDNGMIVIPRKLPQAPE